MRDDHLIPLALVTPQGPRWSTWALALLAGVTPDQIRATGSRRVEDLPVELVRAIRRRASESAAQLQTRDLLTALRFRAAERFGVELVLRDDGVWMARPDVDGWRADG